MPCSNHTQCAPTALAHAEAVCLARGARLTAIRRAVLAEIWADHEATKAYELISRLSREGNPIKPPTIYRALDFLLAHGLIHRIESLNAFVGCSHPDAPHQAIMLICDQCGIIHEQSSEDLNALLGGIAHRQQFTTCQQSIELHGLCFDCQGSAPQSSV
ncbi:MAG: transcriptional repressor [Halothiobacillus sp.]|uniref:transcriptional repressor n=1 Tax=Halothiobacillus sp. TaxID=1891311 RepID=UPI002AD5751E|nr:transcriptional repressor [Halothiobacillus sp.]MDA3878442.1 transcriptional repressor [Halothiobacillus sp.]